VLREAAVAELLNLGDAKGLERIAGALEAGDPQIMDILFRRTVAGGGVPEPLLPVVLARLRAAPDEEERRTALFILRYRGTLGGVAEPMMEAYRRERSHRLAAQIRTVLEELAHR
jgi:hypothetical protein